ncbi:hypothetical protein [Pararhodonellum marinum]|uniref:hypothetical protein n=1 Tax=Pararhodonellum marinum TaxID=2755358 RepID=UPI00188E736D|nr:hypothetical protein [Pararhodonellum marinum]
MKTPPESFLIFKEELKKAQLEKERLKKEYDLKMAEMNQELHRLKEQINSQQEMMKTTLEYAIKLEENMDQFREEMTHKHNLKRNTFL